MAKNNKADMSCARVKKYTASDVSKAERHNERKNETYENMNVIEERIPFNVHFKKPFAPTYMEQLKQMETNGLVSLRGLRKDATLFNEIVIDVNTMYFERNGGYEYAKQFYEEAYHFIEEKFGADNVISAVMHADEINVAATEELGKEVYHYHLHAMVLPVVEKEILWSKRCKDEKLRGTVKEVVNQISHSKKWKSDIPLTDEKGNPLLRKNGKPMFRASYSILQDELFNYMTEQGFKGFQRGEYGSTAEHLTSLQYQIKQDKERLEKLQQRIQKEQVKYEPARHISKTLNEIDGMGQKTFTGKMAISKEDYSQLTALAKEGITSRAEIKSLEQNANYYRQKYFDSANALERMKTKYNELKEKCKPFLEALEHFPDGQDVIRSFENTWYPQDFSFGVEKTFQPLLKSKISKHELRAGEQVDSTVTSSVAGNDSWPENVRLRAQGYYFVGSAEDILHIQQRNSGESAKEYLNRMRSMPNLRQVAAAKANFSNSGETITAVAKRANGDITASDLDKAEAYKVNDLEAGLFGTWVWIISRDSQNKSDREFLKDDVVQLFGSTDTTAVHQATVSSDIVAKQQTVGLNTEIVNEITVRGLPETYGSFKGNNSYVFNEDKKAHIRVWWAGAGSENPTKKDNENYMPGSKGDPSYQEPKEDSHHRLIAKWDVPAVNGVYKIGNGNITLRPIAGTDRSTTEPKVLENNVHIRANKNSESGWYVFVYDFPGSSRALAHKSAYDGLWSRALVEPDVLTTPVSVTTRVSDEKVKAGEKFHDNARITGTLPKGSYVVFSAYEYEDGKGNKSDSNGAKCSDAKNGDAKNGDAKNGSDSETKEIKKAKKAKEAKETKETKETVISAEIEKKMPQSRVNITNKQAEESKKSSISVSSADITLDHEGTVYWKAEVYDAQGNPLATHVLGVEGETVQVSGGEDRSKNDKNDGNDEHDENDEKNEETLSNETDEKNSNENKENGKESKEKVEENHSKTGSDETVNSDDLTDSKNDGNDHTSNQHVGTNSNENASKNYVNQSNTIPTSLAVTGASSVTVILLAVIMLTFASGLSLGRFSAIVPKHGRMSTGARHSEIPPMRRRLVQ